MAIKELLKETDVGDIITLMIGYDTENDRTLCTIMAGEVNVTLIMEDDEWEAFKEAINKVSKTKAKKSHNEKPLRHKCTDVKSLAEKLKGQPGVDSPYGLAKFIRSRKKKKKMKT